MAKSPEIKVDVRVFSLSLMDRNWVRRALETQRSVIIRSRGKEVPGSEIYELRSRELAQVNAVLELVNAGGVAP